MRQVTIYTTNEEYNHFIELAMNLHSVKKIETTDSAGNKAVLKNIRKGFEQLKNIENKKIKTIYLSAFLEDVSS